MTENSAATANLVEECQGLVHFLAKQVSKRMPRGIEMDDLVGYGQIGLLQAAKDFDPKRGVKFSTFAYYRIRGAIYDGTNKLMWFKAVRDPECKYDQMVDSLIQETTSEEVHTEELNYDTAWFAQSVKILAMSYLTSVDGGSSTSEVNDPDDKSPWSGIVERETHDVLNEAINQLSPDSATLIRAVYYHDQTIQEAANFLKISKSWASRLHSRALEQMARFMSQNT